MENKKHVLLLLLLLTVASLFYARTSDPEKILEFYTTDQIQEKFGEVRLTEWVDEFEVKRSGIYFLTERWQYLTYIDDDGSLFFSGVKSRYDYNREEIAVFFIWMFIISAAIIALVLLSSVKWHGFRWYKRLHSRQSDQS